MKKVLIAGEADKTKNYENALKGLGVMPVTSLHVPSSFDYDGLLLPGGGDIDPKLFGQLLKGTRAFDPELDRLQLTILKAFVQDKKPVLGICKGMQLINLSFGGDLIQHLPSASKHEYRKKDQLHATCACKGSALEALYGSYFPVNSAHHQGVDTPGKGIVYTQYAEDGVVEALEHEYLPILGVQWHPERLCFAYKCADAVDGSILLRYFISRL